MDEQYGFHLFFNHTSADFFLGCNVLFFNISCGKGRGRIAAAVAVRRGRGPSRSDFEIAVSRFAVAIAVVNFQFEEASAISHFRATSFHKLVCGLFSLLRPRQVAFYT